MRNSLLNLDFLVSCEIQRLKYGTTTKITVTAVRTNKLEEPDDSERPSGSVDREILRGAAHGPRADRRDCSKRTMPLRDRFLRKPGMGRSPSGTSRPFISVERRDPRDRFVLDHF